MAVVNVAVQKAFPVAVFCAPLVAVQATAPRFAVPFMNCTMPVGPAAWLFVLIVAVIITLLPAVIDVKFVLTLVAVAACVIVTERVFDVAGPL
jgi:hypothetical protein